MIKKALILLTVTAIIFAFSGCRKPENSANGNTPVPENVCIDFDF